MLKDLDFQGLLLRLSMKEIKNLKIDNVEKDKQIRDLRKHVKPLLEKHPSFADVSAKANKFTVVGDCPKLPVLNLVSQPWKPLEIDFLFILNNQI